MSLLEIAITAVIAVAVFLALRSIFTKKSGCSCGCANCDRACKERRK